MRYQGKCKCAIWRSLNIGNIFHVRYLEVTRREVLSCQVQLEGVSLPCLSPPQCFINAKCEAGLLPSIWGWAGLMHRLPDTLITGMREWGGVFLQGFSSACCLSLDRLLSKYCAVSVFLSLDYWINCSLLSLLQALHHSYFITCSLLLILPICVLSLTQFLSTHSLLSSLSCLFILLVAPSYQFEIQKRMSASFLHELLEQPHILANADCC